MAPALMRVLLVEDDAAYSALIGAELQDASIDLHCATSLAAARTKLGRHNFDAILLDLELPDSSGVGTVEHMHELAGSVPIIVLTANGNGLSALAIQRGAQDYLLKSDADSAALVRSLRYARDRAAFRQSIRDGESRFRALVENSYDAMTLLDERGRVLYDSRSVVRVTGYTPEERLGQSMIDASIHPEDLPHISERFEYCLRHPDEVLHQQYRFRHKDGSWRWGEAVGVNRLHDPVVRAIVVNHRDITDRKLVEAALRERDEQLRHAQKMEAVGRLAGGVAHDFNNVLTAIFGYTDLLLDQIRPDDPRRSDVEEIRRAADRAATLTRQLLAFSRKQIMQPRTLDLNHVITSIRKLLARLVGEDISVEIQTDPALVNVRADPGQVEQVLMNLAANARDAMPEGGTLVIATRNETVTAETIGRPGIVSGVYAVVEVADSGSGMPPAVRDRIFEPFYTTKELGKGTGLGLATVYGIVKQTGGGIYVESEEGQGTTFMVYLPEASKAEA